VLSCGSVPVVRRRTLLKSSVCWKSCVL